jgi:hypothetical protein
MLMAYLFVGRIKLKNKALVDYSTKCFFSQESGDINLHEIIAFCCLKSSCECINGFNMLKNPQSLGLY